MGSRASFAFAVVSVVIFAAACGDDDDSASNTADTGGTAGSAAAGSAGSAGGAAGGRPGRGGAAGSATSGRGGAGGSAAGSGGGQATSEFDELKACAAAEPCEGSLAQLIEGSMRNVNRERARCVLTGLRDRTPGRYLHNTDSTFSNGSVGADHLLLVSSGGAVRYARDVYASAAPVNPPEPIDPPAQRCELADPSFFAGCLDALSAPGPVSDATWQCLFGDGTATEPSRLPWFTSCAAEAPRCE
jgi:hypothetical protein